MRPSYLLIAIATTIAVAASLGGAAAAGATPVARGSIGQAYVVGARPAAPIALLDHRGRPVAVGAADRVGSKVFRDLTPGGRYVVAVDGTRIPVRVLAAGGRPALPRTPLREGLNYLTMRDGIELAATVRLPPGRRLADGPLPTLVELSGYQVAAPHDLLLSLLLGGRDPLAPATSTAVGSLIGPLLGYAVVSVQLRGTGCSGGAFDLFDLPSTYDGYDIVETIAAQPWVAGGRVGMVGISFSGITQLFAAGTRPPHLAAIAPMSVTDDLYAGTADPGGILNDGFALSWAAERARDAQPAPGGGQPYAQALVALGDLHCALNQLLRLQSVDPVRLLVDERFREPSLFDHRAAATWMERIEVPTFLVGQLQDEQTGGHFPEAIGRLARNPRVWVTLQNGVHIDALSPSVLTRWVEFLDLYVAGRVPQIPPWLLSISGVLYRSLVGADAAPLQQTRFAGGADVAAARAAFEADPRVRVLMGNGAGPTGPGTLGATWQLDLGGWPAPQVVATPLDLGAGGTLGGPSARPASTVAFRPDPAARPMQTLPGDGSADAWIAQPPYDWEPVTGDGGVGFATAPLPADVVLAGPASLDLQLQSSAPDTDLQVTLSEIRPDGHETYVQSGWLRASHRRLDPSSTALNPIPTHLRQDAAPLPVGRFATVRVPFFAVAHVFRAGSRIRVTVEAPGGDRPRWRLATLERGTTTNTIALGGAQPSRLVLPVVAGATARGTPLPRPTALRGQPDRRYVPAANGG